MQKKDDEQALYISARRVEGYEVEGITEEIDKVMGLFLLFCPKISPFCVCVIAGLTFAF